MTNEEFVDIWERAQSSREVMEKTGSTRSAVSVRAFSLRKKGVHLKRMHARIDVDKLNTLIDSIRTDLQEAGK